MASLFSSTPSRPLVIHSPAARVSIPVAASPLSAWVQSETLSQQFHDSRIGQDDEQPVVEEELEEGAVRPPPSNEPQVKLLARFLGFTADRLSSETNSEVSQVLSSAFDRFNELFLSSTSIHTLVEAYEPEVRAEVLSAYFKAFAIGRKELGEGKLKVAHPSALLGAANAGQAELYALFGGQGVNEVSYSEDEAESSTTSTSYKLSTRSIPLSYTPFSPRSLTRSSSLSPTKPRLMASPTTLRAST